MILWIFSFGPHNAHMTLQGVGENCREHAGSGEEHARFEGQDCHLGQGCGTERKLPPADGVRCTVTHTHTHTHTHTSLIPRLPPARAVTKMRRGAWERGYTYTHAHKHKYTSPSLTCVTPAHITHTTYAYSHSRVGVLVLRLAGRWPTLCSSERYGRHWGSTAATSQ